MAIAEHLEKAWNESLASIDEFLNNADKRDEAKQEVAKHRENLKSSYHNAVAEGSEDERKKFEEKLKATKAKIKAAGYELSE